MRTTQTHSSETRRRGLLSLLLIGCVLVQSQAGRAAEAPKDDKLYLKAITAEKRGVWLEACRAYDDMLRRDRASAAARDGYQRCLRRLHQFARHADAMYRQSIARLTPTQASETYEQILTVLAVAYPDRTRTALNTLFQHGLQELRWALDDATFRQTYLSGVKPSVLEAFKTRLAEWDTPKLTTRAKARDEVQAIFRAAAREGLGLRPIAMAAFTMEFAAGACNSLDEYSAFITPGHLVAIQSALRGKLAGIGVEVGIVCGQVAITEVYPKSPAIEQGLRVHDRIVRVAGELVEDLPAETVADRLRGKPGASVEVEIARPIGDEEKGFEKLTVKLVRRAVAIPSVKGDRRTMDDGSSYAYVKIRHFQESTLQEVKDVVKELVDVPDPVRGVILDLRGNPGGLFQSAVGVAKLFLTEGIVAIGESAFKEYNGPIKVDTAGPYQLPIVVLIDSETASAAEVLAGALKEGRPARTTRLLGQTSYGKGTVQCIIPMEKAPLERLAGIRLTVAKLLSPSSQPYTGRGVTPHETSDLSGEDLLEEARRQLLLLLEGLATPPRIAVARPM